ncbi:MAG: hypothetical protein KJ893_09875 [Candidatus Omnitrophica bacterium]|nr:hypothetical protein [Candidatus Omnitrophota bacterium]MBU4479290.1 hypothetical protein [Candidatus Omnitrophota bacterium]
MKAFATFLLLLMGISCFGAQVLFIREFLVVFYGNELTIGIILANWLLAEALGSFIFGIRSGSLRCPRMSYACLQLCISILFPVSIAAARMIKTSFSLIPGEGVGIISVFFLSLAVILPLGLLLGGQFPLACRLYKDIKNTALRTAIGKSYFLEGAGFALAGIIITCFLIPHIHSLRIAFLIAGLNFCAALFLMLTCLKKTSALIKTGVMLLAITAVIIGYTRTADIFNSFSLKRQWKGFDLIDSRNSIYGNIAVIRQEEQYVFYYDGLAFMTIPSPDIVFTEDFVNFPLAIHESADNIAVIGTGLGGIISNILKFPVNSIDYAELDPLIIDTLKHHPTELTRAEINDPRLIIHNTDGRLFLKKSAKTFDCILINLPAPSTLVMNRFYTREFFEIARQRLSEKGLLCLSLPGALSYLSEEQLNLNQCVYRTLQSVFPGVEVIPGYYNLYIAGKERNISFTPESICRHLAQANIQSPLFNEFYIRDRLCAEKKAWFLESLKKSNARENKDLEPIGVFYSLSLWNASYTPSLQKAFAAAAKLDIPVIIVCLVFFTVVLLFVTISRREKITSAAISGMMPWLVFFSGFTGISINMILLLSLQAFYGYVYLYIGLLIGSFMLGLTLGSFIMTINLGRIQNMRKTLLKIDGGFIMLCFLLIPLITCLHRAAGNDNSHPAVLFMILLSSAAFGFLAGFEFPLANAVYMDSRKEKRNILYAMEMLGSFAGTLSVSIILIPIAGIPATILVIALIKTALFTLLTTSFFFSAR